MGAGMMLKANSEANKAGGYERGRAGKEEIPWKRP
jgi:hypothetical protein